MSKKLKIASISSEVAPFSKTGGLADVCRSLPKALKRLGHDVIVITPFYEQLIDANEYNLTKVFEDTEIYLNSEENIKVSFWKGYLMRGLPVYFIECKKFFSQQKKIYGYENDNARFLVFNVAALKLLSLLKFEADIIHCHDWQSGLIPFYLKTDFRYSKSLRKAKVVYTIHNLAFQFGRNWWEAPADKKDYGRTRIPHIADSDINFVNFAKRAILSADIINTVSEQYREEILTKNFGQDLERILKNREDRLFGIVNGIDYKEYNPSLDQDLFKNYDYKTVRRKKLNKEYLQENLKLPIDRDVPMVCLTSRVTFQKGFELLLKIIGPLLKNDLQFVIMGDGEKRYINELKKLTKSHGKKLSWQPFKGHEEMETLMYAASDIFLLPSHHEPCGINQLIAMRYGCIPVVRKVGGLHDTVTDFDLETGRGTGIVFKNFDEFALFAAIQRALDLYSHHRLWRNMMVSAMRESNSWEIPAKKYIALYRKALRIKN